MENIIKVMSLFGINKKISKIEHIGTGHINLTFKITYDSNESYILQRINAGVFSAPEKIMHNIYLICGFLPNTLRFLTCSENYYAKLNNFVWRAYQYVENSICYDILPDIKHIYGFGRSVGEFHLFSSKADPSKFYETIPGFHDTSARLKKALSVKNSRFDDLHMFFEKALYYAGAAAIKSGDLIVAHSDVKCSNLLFDKISNEPLMLIDLDTVMPGYAMNDFGDGARSACITNGKADIDKYEAYRSGYFSEYKNLSKEQCFLGTVCMASELAARYYCDFAENGNYFSDKTPEQKLSRCRELASLAVSFTELESRLI